MLQVRVWREHTHKLGDNANNPREQMLNQCDHKLKLFRYYTHDEYSSIIAPKNRQEVSFNGMLSNLIMLFIFLSFPYIVVARPEGTVEVNTKTVGLIFATGNSEMIAISQTLWTLLSAILGWLLGTGLLLIFASLVVIMAHKARAGHYAVVVAGAISAAGVIGQVRLLRSLQAKGAVMIVAFSLVLVPYIGVIGTSLLASKSGKAVKKQVLEPFTKPDKKWTAVDWVKADADLYTLSNPEKQQYNLNLAGYGLRADTDVLKVSLETEPGNADIYSKCGSFLLHFRKEGKGMADVAEKVNGQWVLTTNNQTNGPWAASLNTLKYWIGTVRFEEILQTRGVISHTTVPNPSIGNPKVALFGALLPWEDVRDILGYRVLEQFPPENDYYYLYGSICYHHESVLTEQPKVIEWYKLYDRTSLKLPALIDEMVVKKMYAAGHVGQAVGVMWTLNNTEAVLDLQREYAKRLSHRLVAGLPGPVIWRLSEAPVVVVSTVGLIILTACAVTIFALGMSIRYYAGKKAECRPVLCAEDMAARALAPNTISCAGAMSKQSVPTSKRGDIRILPVNNWPLKVTDNFTSDRQTVTLLHLAAWYEDVRSSIELGKTAAKQCGFEELDDMNIKPNKY
ncbi:hypothetical protein K7432_013836 [Basidiobolus ranarum]|uniref:Uncharacterized protein n=1 Tax=Basidiobolus ranarum TaxID=34480 RepID=A0ABR2WIJ2_9FUNG